MKNSDAPLEEKKSYKNLKAVLTIITAVIGIAVAFKTLFPRTPHPIAQSVEIVFDRSEQMGTPLGQEPITRLAAAIETVGNLDISNEDNLALRSFGGPCGSDPSRPDLPFGKNAKSRLQSRLRELRPSGKGSLATAVIAAVDDFNDMAKFEKGSRRIVVITGSDDGCTGDPLHAIQDHIRTLPQNYGIHLDFHFIGLGLTDSQKQVLGAIADGTKGKVAFAENRDELDKVLNRILILEPVADDVKTMVSILNNCVERLNKVSADLNQPDGGTADIDFRAAQDQFKDSDLSFHDLGARQTRPDFQNLYKLASANRELQQRLFTAMDKLIGKKKSADVEGYNVSVAEFNDLINAYNRKIGELNSATQQMNASH